MLARQKNSEARAAGIVVRAQGRRRFAPSDCIQVQNPLVLFWCLYCTKLALTFKTNDVARAERVVAWWQVPQI